MSNYLGKKNKLKKFDLVLNIDSFGEMEPFLIKKYLNFFENLSRNFYFKNTIAKYRPCDLVDHLNKKKNPPTYNLKLNLQKNVINVFDISDDLSYNGRENYTLKHFKERIEIYNKEEFNYEIIPVKLHK